MKIISCEYIGFYPRSGYLTYFTVGTPVDIIGWLSDIEELGIDYTDSNPIFDFSLNDYTSPTQIVDSHELGDSVYEEVCKDFFFKNSDFDEKLGLYNRQIFYCLDEDIQIWFDEEGIIQKIEYICCPKSDFEQRIDVEDYREIK